MFLFFILGILIGFYLLRPFFVQNYSNKNISSSHSSEKEMCSRLKRRVSVIENRVGFDASIHSHPFVDGVRVPLENYILPNYTIVPHTSTFTDNKNSIIYLRVMNDGSCLRSFEDLMHEVLREIPNLSPHNENSDIYDIFVKTAEYYSLITLKSSSKKSQ